MFITVRTVEGDPMFKYEGKEIDELDLKEVFEFEKDLYKKILQAPNAGMSSGMQINLTTP